MTSEQGSVIADALAAIGVKQRKSRKVLPAHLLSPVNTYLRGRRQPEIRDAKAFTDLLLDNELIDAIATRGIGVQLGATDGLVRIVDIRGPATGQAAAEFVLRRPAPLRTTCSFCRLIAATLSELEIVDGISLHARHCKPAWQRYVVAAVEYAAKQPDMSVEDLVTALTNCARSLGPWKGDAEQLFNHCQKVGFPRPESGHPWKTSGAAFRNKLATSPVQAALSTQGVFLWRSPVDVLWRLVSVDCPGPDDGPAAVEFVTRKPPLGAACRYCGIGDEPHSELVRLPGRAGRFHQPCTAGWWAWERAARAHKGSGSPSIVSEPDQSLRSESADVCVVSRDTAPEGITVADVAVHALRDLVQAEGAIVSGNDSIPEGTRAVALERWRSSFAVRYGTDRKGDAIRKAFLRARETLSAQGLIGIAGDYAWTTAGIDAGASATQRRNITVETATSEANASRGTTGPQFLHKE